jgi:hypothetical protein
MLERRLTRASLCFVVLAVTGCSESPAPPVSAPASAEIQPMPASGFRVEWGIPGAPCTMKAGSTVAVGIVVKNASDQTWRDFGSTEKGKRAVRLGYRWWDAADKKVVVDYTPFRGELRTPLAPGKSATMAVAVVAPPTPGEYLLQLDLVEELVTWFADRGAPKVRIPVTVN